MNRLRFGVFVTGVATCLSVHGHPGGLDANGGHLNRKTGEYHTHRAPAAAAAPAPAPFAARLTPPAPRLSPRTTAPREAAWAEVSDSKNFRTALAAQKLKEVESDPVRHRKLLLEIVADYSDTPVAQKARRMLEDGFAEAPPRADSGPAERSGKHAESKLLNEMLAEYPESDAATEAKVLLRVLP